MSPAWGGDSIRLRTAVPRASVIAISGSPGSSRVIATRMVGFAA
jgi:hypothetical protein